MTESPALVARRDIRARASGLTRLDHPLAGMLELSYEKMILPKTRELLVVYHEAPGSPTAERRLLLAVL